MTDRRLQHPEKRIIDHPQNTSAMCEGKSGLTYEQAVSIIRRHKTKEKGVIAYKCPKCRRWHIGNPAFGKKRRQRHA